MDCLQLDDELEAWQRTAGDLRAYFRVGHMAIMCLVIISPALHEWVGPFSRCLVIMTLALASSPADLSSSVR